MTVARRSVIEWIGMAGLLLALAGIVGVLVMLSGIASIKASSGHWPVTAWVLDFAKVRSVSTHALGLEGSAQDDPVLVLQGAGHYETGCAPCHGAPGSRMPMVMGAMTPAPPYLPPKLARWDAQELFYIVKHGIKFTGMPAWPAQNRDDEVRAVVAFLLALPELDMAEYRRLVHGAGPAPTGGELTARLAAPCGRCHGTDGRGRELPAFPKLAGQKRGYLSNALRAYAQGTRHSGVMQPIAAALTAEERERLAAHYSELPADGAAARVTAGAQSARIARGEAIAREGLPGQGIPSCIDCHGPGPQRRNAAYPLLAGQPARYLRTQLNLFATKRRGGSPFAHLMERVTNRLTPEQMHDAASYYESIAAPTQRTPQRASR
jgi:cytochrome c553